MTDDEGGIFVFRGSFASIICHNRRQCHGWRRKEHSQKWFTVGEIVINSAKLSSTQRTFTAFSLYEIMTLLCAIFIFVFLSFINDLHHVTYQSL